MTVFFCYLVKSDFSSLHYCKRVHWTGHFTQGTSKTRPCLTGHLVDASRVGEGAQGRAPDHRGAGAGSNNKGNTHTQTEGRTDGGTDRRTDRQTDGETDGRTDRETDRHI